MITRMAWLELRQQVGGRVFWIVFAVSVLMVGGAMAIDELRVGLPAVGARTGVAAIVRTHLVWSLFFLFTAAALVGEAALRDRSSGFSEVVGATPVEPRRYALGRFAGALGALLLCFLSVPAAMAVGGLILGEGAGPGASYLFACLALALPNLLLAAALFFALAQATRSMAGCLLGAAGVLTIYGLAGGSSGTGAGLVEPFGFAAVHRATLGWSVSRGDAETPPLADIVLANRLLWMGVTATLIGLGAWLSGRTGRSVARLPARPARAASHADLAEDRGVPGLPKAGSGGSRVMMPLAWRTRFESGRIVRTPAFAVLLIMGLANAAAAASRVTGTPETISTLVRSFQLVPVVVVLFFAGELFWAECEHKVAPIIAATPVSEAAMILAKLFALALMLVLLAAASAGAGAVTQLATGQLPSPALYLSWYVLPQVFDWLLLGVLAFFLQSLASNKLAGWGYLVFYLIGSLALNRLGWQDPHYRYGGYPGAPLPPELSGAHDVGWYRLGWGLVAVGLVVLTCRISARRSE